MWKKIFFSLQIRYVPMQFPAIPFHFQNLSTIRLPYYIRVRNQIESAQKHAKIKSTYYFFYLIYLFIRPIVHYALYALPIKTFWIRPNSLIMY